MNRPIRFAALDLDGTLFDSQSRISERDQAAIRKATSEGVHVVISTGRPYVGLPVETLLDIGVRYAITANGAAIYQLSGKKCLHSSCMEPQLVCPIIEKLQEMDIHMDAFIDGDGYSQSSCQPKIDHIDAPPSIRKYIRDTRTFTDDLAAFIRERGLAVQKMTLNFYPLPDGSYKDRENAKALLSSRPEVTFLSGGYHNLEFTRAGVTKGKGLLFLCGHLGIDIRETMACGDTQNDIDILKTAAVGVAMGNADAQVKEAADFVTLSHEESGVAYALSHFIPGT